MASGRTSSIWRDGEFETRDDVCIRVMRHAAHGDPRAAEPATGAASPTLPVLFRRATGVLAHSTQHARMACLARPVLVPRSRPLVSGGSSRLCTRSVA